jgi:hypothetical protein
MTEIQNFKPNAYDFFDFWNLFVIWCLGFVIYKLDVTHLFFLTGIKD